MDRRSLFTGAVVIVLIVLFPLTISYTQEKSASILLVTPEEAALPEGKELIELEDGPSILIETPESGSEFSAGDSFRLHVVIDKSEGGHDINMDSFRIKYLKLPTIDITERLRDYIKETELDAPAVELPSGNYNHRMEFYVEDTKGNPTAKLFIVKSVE